MQSIFSKMTNASSQTYTTNAMDYGIFCYNQMTKYSESSTAFHHTANNIVCKHKSKTELSEYLYGCCGSLAVSTFKFAIKMESSSHGLVSNLFL